MLILENVLGHVAHSQSEGSVLEAFFFPNISRLSTEKYNCHCCDAHPL